MAEFCLLQNVLVTETSEEHVDFHGRSAVIVMMKQLPGQLSPSITVMMDDNKVLVEDLLTCDLETA